jgi:hypothetical protein
MTKHDTEAIRHLIARQFNSMCWTPNNSADWKAFAADFAPRAAVYPVRDRHNLRPSNVLWSA